MTADPFLPELAERLHNLTRAGFDATLLVLSAAAAAPLPDDHPAAALWWRILDQLPDNPRTRTQRQPTPSQRRGARPRGQRSSSDLGRARRRLPPSAQAADPRRPTHQHRGGRSRWPVAQPQDPYQAARRPFRAACRPPARAATRRHPKRCVKGPRFRDVSIYSCRPHSTLDDADVEVHQDVRPIGARPRRISCRICSSAGNVRSSLPFADGGPAAVL